MLNESSNLCESTEEQLLVKAKELFFSRGLLHASTQEIADFAGVNRTLVNYYFRSKQNLFAKAHAEVMKEMKEELARVYLEKIPFREKVELFIDFVLEFRDKYPFLEVFNIHETAKISNREASIVQPKYIEELSVFLCEIDEEIKTGRLKFKQPIDFIITIIALISYPKVMKPIYQSAFNISEHDYEQMLAERKEVALRMVFN